MVKKTQSKILKLRFTSVNIVQAYTYFESIDDNLFLEFQIHVFPETHHILVLHNMVFLFDRWYILNEYIIQILLHVNSSSNKTPINIFTRSN